MNKHVLKVILTWPWMLAVLFVTPSAVLAQVSLTSPGTAYTQDFNTLASTGTSSTLPAGFTFVESGTNANTAYTAGTGSSNSGDTYSFGATGATDRALGGLRSGALVPTFGAAFTNNTGTTILSLAIAYTGEQWRLGTASRTDQLDFQYSLDATSLTTGTWTDVNALDFVTPNTTGAGLKDGNLAANRTALSSTLSGLSIANGATFWIRYTDVDATGADDGLAIDDFSLTPNGTPAGITLSINDASVQEGNAGTTTAQFTVSLSSPAPAGGVTFDIATADNTATTAGNDYVANSLTGQTIPTGSSTYTFSVLVTGDASFEPTETFFVNVTNLTGGATIADGQGLGTITNDDTAPVVRIRDIQGTAHISPRNGQAVTNVQGIVTAVRSSGFYMQDPSPDTDDRTSEGIFVFTNTAPASTIQIGDLVQVNGTVTEFRPGNDANSLTITEISTPTINELSAGNTITPTVLGVGGRTIPTTIIEDQTGNVETGGLIFDPASDGIDFYESLEGMLVQINNPVAVSPTNDFGELWVLADNGAGAGLRTPRGGIITQSGDFNPERIQIDDVLSGSTPVVNVGAQLNTFTGVVDYSFGNFEVLPATAPAVVNNSLQRETTTLTPTNNQLTVATFNVENLDPSDVGTKFSNLASRIVTNLGTPDIISLAEIQDNNGPANDAVVDAGTTFQTLISAITTAGGPTYEFRQINPVDDQDGGEPGGNIRVGFLYKPSRVTFVDRVGGTSTNATSVNNVNGQPQLSFSPGRIDPTNSAFSASRKPLVGEFLFNGQTIFVIANHFNSKGGDQPLFGVNQPPVLSSETQRNQQATIVKNFVQSILGINANARVIVAGDLNDFEFSNSLNTLKSAGLTALIETLPANERYSYNFEGNAQTLDHILVSSALTGTKLDGFDVVHINSEFAEQDSDHDPGIARFNLAPPVVATLTGTTTICVGSPANLSVTISGGTGPYTVILSNGSSPNTVSNYASGNPIAVMPPGNTTYTLASVTDANGTTSGSLSGTAVVTVNSATATLSGSLTVCPGQTTILTASGGGTYLWSTSAASSTVGVGTGTYSVTVTGANTCTASASATVTASTPPAATLSNSGPISATNATVTLTAATGAGYTYAFSSGASQQGAPSGSTATVTTPGLYSVTVTGPNGCTATASTTVAGGVSPGVCRGARTVLNVVATGIPSFTYQWYKNGTAPANQLSNISTQQIGTTTSSLTLVTGQPGDYYVKVTDGSGKVTLYGPFRVTTLATCPSDRMATEEIEPGTELRVTLMPNPLNGDWLRATIWGAEGRSLRVELTDMSGRPVREQRWKSATAEQPIGWNLGGQPEGIYLLRATLEAQESARGQRYSLKVIKP